MTPKTEKPRPAGNGVTAHIKNSTAIVSPADLLLDRLSGVKQTRPDRYQARCPAHDDKSPSLVITETSDGTLLIKCWAGCSADAIVGAVGLELRDLFPPKFNGQEHRASKLPRYSASEVVKTVIMEATILTLGYQALQRGEALSFGDSSRVDLAIGTIDNLREVTR